MVIAYRVNRLTAWLARQLLRVPHIGLINIVAGRPVVPELLQEAVSPPALAALALSALQDPAEARRIRGELTALRATMGEGGSSRRAAASVGAVLHQARDHHTDVRVPRMKSLRGLPSSSPVARRAVVRLLGWLLRGLFVTLRPEFVQRQVEQQTQAARAPILFAFWHGRMLYFMKLYEYLGARVTILVSHSRDGELVAQLLSRFGFQTARGLHQSRRRPRTAGAS